MASKTVTVLLALAASVGARAARLETKEEMIAFLSAHPSRAYFSRLIRDGQIHARRRPRDRESR